MQKKEMLVTNVLVIIPSLPTDPHDSQAAPQSFWPRSLPLYVERSAYRWDDDDDDTHQIFLRCQKLTDCEQEYAKLTPVAPTTNQKFSKSLKPLHCWVFRQMEWNVCEAKLLRNRAKKYVAKQASKKSPKTQQLTF